MKNLSLSIILVMLIIESVFSQCQYEAKYKEYQNKANTASTKVSSCSQGYYQYANYYANLCYCEQEWTEGDLNRLVNTINACVKIINAEYSSCGGKLQYITASKCKGMAKSSNSSNSTSIDENDKFSIYEDPLINKHVQGFIHDLAANSNNPDLKTLSKELEGINEVQSNVDQYRGLFNLEASQNDLAFENIISNAAQAYSVIKFLVNSVKSEQELSPSQQQASSVMRNLLIRIKQLHIEQNISPSISSSKLDQLQILEDYKKSFYTFDLATAKERLLLIKFYLNSKYLTMDELESLTNEVYSMSSLEAIKEIDQLQNKYDFENSFYLANYDQSFKINLYLCQLKAIRILKENGQEKEASVLENKLDVFLSYGEVVKIMQESFYDGDYETTARLYPLAKEYFTANPHPNYPEISSDYYIPMGPGKKDLTLSQDFVLMLLSSGIYSELKENQYATLDDELTFLNNLKKINSIRGDGTIEGINTLVFLQQGEFQLALNEIDKGISLLKDTYGIYNWLHFLKFQVLIELKEYDLAHSEYELIKRNHRDIVCDQRYGYASSKTPEAFFNIYELKFEKCVLLYKEKDYESALSGLSLLEVIEMKPKYLLLRKQIDYAKQN